MHDRRWDGETLNNRFVIGAVLGEAATAIPYGQASQIVIFNDWVGDSPVVFYVDPERRDVPVYLRQTEDRILKFWSTDAGIIDEETGTTWSMDRGLAQTGELAGQALRTIPHIPAFPDAWRDFYPQSRWPLG